MSEEADAQAAIATKLVEAAAAGDAAQRASREFKLELSGEHLIPPSELAALRAQSDEHARRLERLLGTLTFLRTTRQREALLAGSTSRGGGDTSTDGASPSDLIALGMKVQVESQEAVSRMTRMVESTRQVGASALRALEGQHARLDGIRATVSAQVYQYAEAEKALSEYVSFSLGDNLTLLLLMLIALALTVLVVYKLTVVDPTGAAARARGWPKEVYSALDVRSEL